MKVFKKKMPILRHQSKAKQLDKNSYQNSACLSHVFLMLALFSFVSCTSAPNNSGFSDLDSPIPSQQAAQEKESPLTLSPSITTITAKVDEQPGVSVVTDSKPSPEPVSEDLVTGLRIEAERRFLTASGQRVQLSVQDQEGRLIASERLSFRSSRSQDLSVNAQGNVQALTSEGFSTIMVSLKDSSLRAELLFSVSNPTFGSSGGGGGSSSGNTAVVNTEENVNGEIEFQF